MAASQAAFDADWVPLLPGEAGGPPAATPLSAVSPGDAPDAVAHAHRLYAFQVRRVEASLPPGAGRDARLWRVNAQLRANLAACAPTPRRDAVDHALFRHDVSAERITESCPAGALHNFRLGGARERLLLAAAAFDSLAAALRRSSASAHAVLVTRRELRRLAEVPVATAGHALDGAMADELAAWADLPVFEEVPFGGQRVLSTRWVITLKEPESPSSAPRRKARLVLHGFEDPKRTRSTPPPRRRRAPPCGFSYQRWRRGGSCLGQSMCALRSCRACPWTARRPCTFSRRSSPARRRGSFGACANAPTA